MARVSETTTGVVGCSEEVLEDVQKTCSKSSWANAFGLANWLPFVGPALAQTKWIKNIPLMVPGGDAPSNTDLMARIQGQLDPVVSQWRKTVVDSVLAQDEEIQQMVSTIPEHYMANIQSATEPLREDVVLIVINLFFLMVVVGFIVLYYA